MERCLLIGNGLNQCLKDGIAWNNLLRNIANDFNLKANPNIPMPLEFERLVNQYLASQQDVRDEIYLETKKKVAEKLMNVKLPIDAIHHKLKTIKVDTLMTTNYDLLLEQVFDRDFEPKINKNTKYPEKNVGIIDGISFYHPHGCGVEASTICLGYEHYMGIVEKARKALNTTKKQSNDKIIKRILFGEEQFENTWMEKFYTSDISIIGFGLYQCEVDFWWLLTHRASLYYTNYHNIRKKLTNTITYYDIINDIEADEIIQKNNLEQECKHQLLQGLHVDVCKYKLSNFGSYIEAYTKIIDDIAEKDSEGNRRKLWRL